MLISLPANIEIKLRDGIIVHRETGSRTVLPQDTVLTVENIFEKLGVDRIELIDQQITDGVPVYKVNDAPVKAYCHRHACNWAMPPTPLNNPPRETYGKGMSIQQSKASALMESVERFCGQRFPHNEIVHARYEDIVDIAIKPSAFRFLDIPRKCDECGYRDWDCFSELDRVATEWSWGYSLTRGMPVLVPSAMVFYPYISDDDRSFIFNDTGGLSAGNTLEEAILGGIAEVIERDALCYAFHLGKVENMPVVNFINARNGNIQKYLSRVLPAKNLFSFCIENSSIDLGIFSFTTLICYSTGKNRRYFGGSGTSLTPEIALLRSLTELEEQKVIQKALTVFDRGSLIEHSNGIGNTVNIESLPDQSTGNIKTDIELYIERLKKSKAEVIVVNLTHPGLGIPAVRVLIPQLIAYSGIDVRESLILNVMKNFGVDLDRG